MIGGEDGSAVRAAPEVKKLQLAQAPPALLRPKGESVRATPLVRRIAAELGVDLAAVAGTGPQGRVTEEDVRAAATDPRDVPETGTEGRRIPLRGTPARDRRAHGPRAPRGAGRDLGRGVRLRARRARAPGRDAAQGLRAVAQEYPELNARLEGDEIVYLDRYDLGVAVQTEQGLVVPVVRGCDARSIEELDADVRRLAEAARAGKLTPEELRGSTFTVTSAGKLGGLLQTPIVNHPEVAILSVGRIGPRPVVRDGEVVPRPVGMIAITFDHRVVDGARAAEFGLAVIRRLEEV